MMGLMDGSMDGWVRGWMAGSSACWIQTWMNRGSLDGVCRDGGPDAWERCMGAGLVGCRGAFD